MNTKSFYAILLLALLTSACAPSAAAGTVEAATSQPIENEAGESSIASPESAVLLFSIGMHIEPMGETAQGYRGGKADYHQPQFFERHVQDILAITQIVEAHGGRMTIQAQSPFTSVAIETGDSILADLAARGHELALHFHEDAHLGKNSTSRTVQEWCDVMKQEMSLITQASGVTDIRYWSGGNLYPDLFEAAACAGLDVNSDWKNPETQSTDLSLVGVTPWRPAGGTDGTDFALFTQHDPDSAVVFLPEGQYDKSNFASMRRSDEAGGDEAYFEYLKESLYTSLEAVQAGKVNVFHFTIHPGEFRGDPQHPFAVIEKFLTEVVDPLVASGQVQWATFSEMADAYAAWEQTAISVKAPDTEILDTAYISFIINVHDWSHPAESADILLQIVDLFEKYGVRGDFYFTAEITRALAETRPDVIERFRNSDMTISYHVRPPHPLYTGFDSRLKNLSDAELYQTLLDYETYALNLETGELDRSQPGGYAYVAQVFGRNPIVAPAPNSDPRIKDAAQRVYAALGAQMTLLYHESGTKVDEPFEYVNDLLVRPSNFSVTRTTLIDGTDNFWWNFMSKPNADAYNPTALLQSQLAEWDGQFGKLTNSRAPFITSLVHENNFYRNGAEAWSSIYFTMDKDKKGKPLPPPWNLSAPDPSKLRAPEDQSAIFAAYEQMVAYAASNLIVVTSEDILQLAG